MRLPGKKSRHIRYMINSTFSLFLRLVFKAKFWKLSRLCIPLNILCVLLRSLLYLTFHMNGEKRMKEYGTLVKTFSVVEGGGTCRCVTLTTTNSMRPVLRLNRDLRGQGPVTDYLDHVMNVPFQVWIFSRKAKIVKPFVVQILQWHTQHKIRQEEFFSNQSQNLHNF